MNDFFEFMLYVIGAIKHYGLGPLAIKASFGFCPAGISMGANPNAMLPEEHLGPINIYAKNMMGPDSEHYIGFDIQMRDKETMRRTLAADFEDKKVEKRKPISNSSGT